MKKNVVSPLFVLSALLFGCNTSTNSSITSSSTFSSEDSSSLSSEEDGSSVSSSEEESSSVYSDEGSSISEESSSISEEESSTMEDSSSATKEGTYHFYCVNDFHGSILEKTNNYYEPGIAKYFGELKRLKEEDPDHTIILSAGDMYQGSLESNSNYGELVTLAMNNVGFDAMTVGNHEFDYGVPYLLDNIELASFPVLGGNIMKFEEGKIGTEPWDEDKFAISTIIDKPNAKIGIVGMIGEGQTTSITSRYVDDMDFVPHESLAKTEATRLKEEEDCDIVLLLIHDEEANVQYAADKDYFDGVFCAHTHRGERSMSNGVPFVQSYCNGEGISHFDLTLDEGNVICSDYETIESESYWEEDEEIAAIRDSFIKDEAFVAIASQEAGNVTGTLTNKEGVPNVSCKAIYEKYSLLEDDLVCAMTNTGRASLRGNITYSDIYKAVPFMNAIAIVKVKGQDIIDEAAWNNSYTGDLEKYGTIDKDAFYKIAIIDYLVYHKSTKKVFDYFPSMNPGQGGEIIKIYEDYPFDIMFNYIKNDLNGKISYSNFRNYSQGFNLYNQ